VASCSAVTDKNLDSASLKYVCPSGVYVSLTPGDPAIWVGVMFIRKGKYLKELLSTEADLGSVTGLYAPAILRFRITFPPSYPSLPPSVTFSTDIFHPLLTPLTTYTYTTSSTGSDTVSATDDERLPPGGFSLRHGFPQWFGRSKRKASKLTTPPRQSDIRFSNDRRNDNRIPPSPTSVPSESPGSEGYTTSLAIPIVRVLRYVRSCFDDESVLDSIPLEAAGNPGAWYARQTYLRKSAPKESALGMEDDDSSVDNSKEKDKSASAMPTTPLKRSARKAGEWNWEGVWEERVKKGVEGSLAEPVLYGNVTGGDDIVSLDFQLLASPWRLTDQCADSISEHGREHGSDYSGKRPAQCRACWVEMTVPLLAA
jgi:hypothetical protein